ncbi:DUF6543 domain-containing protein [Luteibacter sp. CQ10]|uniref:dermonecrotic toxin domain-containing protein n=1 Tax=Luteibacter sp. CQ10 TaxID=2805821 RepID=UPI0034A49AAB
MPMSTTSSTRSIHPAFQSSFESFRDSVPNVDLTVANELRSQFKARGIDVDPDKAHLVTFGHRNRVLSDSLTLTEAAKRNMGRAPWGSDQMISSVSDPDRFLEGQLPLGVEEFKSIVWNTSFTDIHERYLNNFWDKTEERTPRILSMSYFESMRHSPLSDEGRQMAQRVLGIAGRDMEDIMPDDIRPSPTDPGMQLGFVGAYHYDSSDLMYARDTRTNRFLLWHTDSTSPLREFDSRSDMVNYLASVDRDKLATHFQLADRRNGGLYPGLDEKLEYIAKVKPSIDPSTGSEKYSVAPTNTTTSIAPDIAFELHAIKGDAFAEMARRMKDRTYADGRTAITSNSDYTKQSALDTLNVASLALLPLGIVYPPFGVALGAIAGAANVGVGIDDAIKGEPDGTSRIIAGGVDVAFGALDGFAALKGVKAPKLSRQSPAATPAAARGRPTPTASGTVSDALPSHVAGSGSGPSSSPAIQSARMEFDDLVRAKSESLNDPSRPLSDTTRERFHREVLPLIQKSNAEQKPHVVDYIEAGSKTYNQELRSGSISDDTRGFLDEFMSLSDYHGRSYRSAYVTPEAVEALKSPEPRAFSDRGVQSASTQPINAHDWHRTWANDGVPSTDQKVVFVFDEKVPQKNLSTGFLADHVAVAPDTPLEVVTTREHDETLFVYLRPSSLTDVHDLYTGTPRSLSV